MGNQNILLAMAGKRAKAKKKAALAPLRKVVAQESEPTLDGVSFASDRARKLAQEADLSWRDFLMSKSTGCSGFTAADVRTIIERMEEEES